MSKKKKQAGYELNADWEIVETKTQRVEKSPEESKNFFSPFAKFFTAVVRKAKNIIFPPKIKCIVCGRDLKQEQNIEICDKCEQQLPFIDQNQCCMRCGAEITGQGSFCLNCMQGERQFDIAKSVFVYENEIAKLIAGFKYKNKPYLHRTFGHCMARILQEQNWDIDVIIPVPLSDNRLKWRGFNQAQLLAECIGDIVTLPVNTEALAKIKDTEQQANLSLNERKQNLFSSFKVLDKYSIKNKNVLLIDDVMTSGETANACANILKKAGVNRVFVLTIAHGKYEVPTQSNLKIDKTDIQNT